MTSVSISSCTVDEIASAPNIDALLDEYGAASAIDGLGTPAAQLDTYRLMEANGAIRVLGAFKGDVLIGFLVLIVSAVPHYGTSIGSAESYFVTRSERKSGAGLLLLKSAESIAADLGANGMFISSPINNPLETILPRVGYRPTNSVFFKAFK